MRLLRCLLMIFATLSMTVHVTAAPPEGHVGTGTIRADLHEVHRPGSSAAHIAAAARHCPPDHHHKTNGCCDALCCSAPCVGAVSLVGAPERTFRSAVRPLPASDLLPTDALHGRLIRPPIAG